MILNFSFVFVFFRFRLQFEKESKEEVERRKKLARETVLQQVSDKELEVDINEIYPSEKGSLGLETLLLELWTTARHTVF